MSTNKRATFCRRAIFSPRSSVNTSKSWTDESNCLRARRARRDNFAVRQGAVHHDREVARHARETRQRHEFTARMPASLRKAATCSSAHEHVAAQLQTPSPATGRSCPSAPITSPSSQTFRRQRKAAAVQAIRAGRGPGAIPPKRRSSDELLEHAAQVVEDPGSVRRCRAARTPGCGRTGHHQADEHTGSGWPSTERPGRTPARSQTTAGPPTPERTLRPADASRPGSSVPRNTGARPRPSGFLSGDAARAGFLAHQRTLRASVKPRPTNWRRRPIRKSYVGDPPAKSARTSPTRPARAPVPRP